MNKKLKDIIAAVALSLSQLAPYSPNSITTQPKQPSGIEAIVENLNSDMGSSQYKLSSDYTKIFFDSLFFDSLYRHLDDYLKQHSKDKEDTTSRVPLKFVNVFPESVMGGILGFTYIGDHSMGKRDDLIGELSREVDVHESIHTPDEYETRVLTEWIMSGCKPTYN